MGKIKFKDRMRVLFLASEVSPFAKAGGLGDVVGSLPESLAKNFHLDIKIMIPRYKMIDLEKWKSELIIDDIKIKLLNGKNTRLSVYKSFIPGSIIPVYFLDMPQFFTGEGVYDHGTHGKNTNFPFINFSKAALELIKIMDWQPNVIHVHDWMPAITIKWLKTVLKNNNFFQNTATAFTIHNIAFQGTMDIKEAKNIDLKKSQLLEPSKIQKSFPYINILAEAVINADMVNTVSPNYAKELLTKKYAFGMEKIFRRKKKNFTGILNGIDYQEFDPRTNQDTPIKYWISDLDKKVENKLYLQKKFGLTQTADLPLICVVSRLTDQKGLDLVEDVLKDLVDMGAQFIVLGSGDKAIERIFVKAQKQYPKSIEAEMEFDAHLAQTIYAGSDMLLMPSRFEPCGLSQIISMRFGTIPIVRRTGGLADTVRDGYTGFVFNDYDKNAFLWAIQRAVDVYYNQKDFWRKMQIRCMKKDFSWHASAKKYIWLYKKAIQNHKKEIKGE